MERRMPAVDQLPHDGRTYKTCGTCNENTHIPFLLGTGSLEFRTDVTGVNKTARSG